MKKSSGFRSGQERIVLQVVGWVVVVAVGVGLLLFGYALGKRQCASTQPSATEPTAISRPSAATPTVVPPVFVPTATTPSGPILAPTITPLPEATVEPTPAPPADTPAPAMIEAGPDGLNIRSGPDTDAVRLAHVDPGTKFMVIGRYEDWWQIDYNGVPAWVYSGVVTAYNTDNVPEVQPALSQ